MDSIFNNFRSSAKKEAEVKTVQGKDDIHIVTEKSRAKVSEQFERVQAAKKPVRSQGMKDRMSRGQDESNPSSLLPLRRTRSSSEMRDGDSPEAPREPKLRRIERVPPGAFYSGATGTGSIHETRSSRRVSRELAPRSPLKPRTPSPERWTELYPEWEKMWRNSIIYPKEGKNKATVDKQDIRRLDEGEFLNDNLIMFYLLQLERDLIQRRPELSERIYFHNTFFYTRLSKPEKGKKGINYEAVERWTAKVDLFSYDYIIVPVNEHTHWYVAIICNAPKLLEPEPNALEDSQIQEVSADSNQRRYNTDANINSSPASSPKPRPDSSSGNSLTEHMKQVSLMGAPIDLEEKETPHNEPEPRIPAKRLTPQETSPDSPSDRHTLKESPKTEQKTNVVEGASAPAAPAKKGKRKSIPPRKYNPKEPRIITLDSLGISHSVTCTNLRDYLIAEMKSKRNTEIPIPRQLGMTATKIPHQKNYCDCGLFLLSYIEQFLKCPDEFTEALLQKVDIEVDYDFTPAPKMRTRIREILFDLQAEQMVEKNGRAEAKSRSKKKASEGQGKEETAISTKSNSREPSKGARDSVDPESHMSTRVSALPELSGGEDLQRRVSQSPQPGPFTLEPTSELQAEPRQSVRNTEGLAPESPIEPDLPKASERVSQEPIDLEDADRGASRAIRRTFAEIFKPFPGFKDEAGSLIKTRPGRSRSDAVQIDDDSPQKTTHDAPQIHDPDSPSTQLRDERDRELLSPFAERDIPLSDHRDRPPTPYPREENDVVSHGLHKIEDTDRIMKSPIGKHIGSTDSSPLQPALNIPDIADDVGAGQEEAKEDDDIMLLDREPIDAPPLLTDSPSTPLTSPSKRQSATSPRQGSNRKPSPRKGPRSSEPANVCHSSGSMVLRDHSDLGLIGKHMAKPVKFKGRHTKFSP